MKKVLAVSAVIALACLLPAASLRAQAKQPTQAAPTPAGDTFTGTIVTGHMKGGIANPHLLAEVKGDDGQKVAFILRKSTTVTDVDGKTLNFMRDFRKGKKVEIKYSVKDGQNEALSMHYLD
ncbi:MAG TPA: hypothetical protein VMS75_07425 [Terriglobales bacterium]|nr:hypothetical protein [Terriglobales bacterium]